MKNEITSGAKRTNIARSMAFNFSLIAFVLIFLVSASAGFAAHDSTVSVSPEWSKASTPVLHTISVTNEGCASGTPSCQVKRVEITIPTPYYTILTCGAVPSGWSLDASTSTTCTYITSSSYIHTGNPKSFTLTATTASTSGTYVWDVTTKDRNSDSDFNNPTSKVDADVPIGTIDSAALPPYSTSLTFNVPYTANDNLGGSGVASVKLYYSTTGGATWAQYDGTYTSSPISFTATGQGTYSFNVRALDNAGNEEAMPSGAGSIEDSIIVDTTAPTGTVYADSSLITDGNLVQEITVKYNEVMSGTSTPTIDFSAGTWTPSTGTWTSNNVWTQSFTLTDTNEEINDVSASSSGAKDLAGNTEGPSVPDSSFNIDTKNPTVTVIIPSPTLIADSNIGAGTFTITIDYNEAMLGSSTPTITFSPAVASTLILAGGSWTDSNTYVATYDVADAGVTVADVDISVSGATDAAGNTQILGSATNAFDIDTKNPTVSIVTTDAMISEADDGKTVDIVATFSEPMNAGFTPTISFDADIVGSGILTLVDDSWSAGNTTYTATYEITDRDDEISGVDVSVSNIMDVAGNAQYPNPTTKEDLIDVDTITPIVTIDSVTTPTNQVTQKITGTFVETNINTIAVNGVPATIVAGTYSVIIPLVEGSHTITAVATDLAGNTGNNVTSINRDTIKPTITDVLPMDSSYTNDNTPTISATLGDTNSGINVVSVTLTVDGVDVTSNVNTIITATSITYTPSTSLPEGTIAVVIYAEDNAGNDATSTTGFTVDTAEPDSTIVAYTPDPTNSNTPTYSGTATDATSPITSVEYKVDGSSWIAATPTDGAFDELSEGYTFTTAALSDGNHTIYVRATDSAGNVETSPALDGLTVDVTEPNTILTAYAPDPTNDSTPTYSGTATDATTNVVDIEYRVDSGAWTDVDSFTPGTSVPFTFTTAALSDGNHTIQTRAKDAAGNWETTYASDTVVVDTVAPTSSASSPTYDNAGTILVSFTASDATSGVASTTLFYRFNNGTWTNSTLTLTGTAGTFAFDPVGVDGTYEFYTRATDVAGNVENALASADDSTIFDDTIPTITSYNITNPLFSPNADAQYDTATINLAFPETVEYTIEIRNSTGYIVKSWVGTAKTPEPKVWNGIGNTGNGVYTVNVSAKDLAGNTMASDISRTITLDTQGPTISAITGNVIVQKGNPTAISATITDTNGVSGAILYYTYPNGTSSSTAMSANGSTYTATIPAISEHGTITYYITATDSVANARTSTNYSVTVYDFILSLNSGWNQISLPKTIDSASNSRIMNYLVYSFTPVERSIDGKWICNEGTSCGTDATLSEVKPAVGYFVLKSGSGTDYVGIDYDASTGTIPSISAPSIKLSWGWNLVGYGCEAAKPVSTTVPASTLSMVDEIAWYDTTKYISGITSLETGKGYWALIAKKDIGTDVLWTSKC